MNEIHSNDIEVGDRIRISNPHRSRFAIIVDRIHDLPSGRVVAGRQIMIGEPNVICGSRHKVASLRPATRIERYG
jgi:hypothetical protein